jgi:hypothetical protein
MFTFNLAIKDTFYFDINLEEINDITIKAPLILYDNLTLDELDNIILGDLDYTKGKGKIINFDLTLKNIYYFNI